jgi:hypothetical protein
VNDPSLPLQAAVYAALTTSPGLGASVYDRVPIDNTGKVTAAFPYIHIGEDQITSDADQCHDAMTAYATVHVWSRAVGKVEAKTIMAEVCERLDLKLNVIGFGVIAHGVDDGPRHLTDRDGLTSHSVVTFRYLMAAGA